MFLITEGLAAAPYIRPAVQLAAQGTLESIAASPNGIVAENGLPSDDFTENAMQRSEQVQHKLDELYGALEK